MQQDPDYIEFHVVYLTTEIDLHPGAQRSVAKGLVLYRVYAKNAEDAIMRLREQEPAQHKINEIMSVEPARGKDGNVIDSSNLILPKEWGAVMGRASAASKFTH